MIVKIIGLNGNSGLHSHARRHSHSWEWLGRDYTDETRVEPTVVKALLM